MISDRRKPPAKSKSNMTRRADRAGAAVKRFPHGESNDAQDGFLNGEWRRVCY